MTGDLGITATRVWDVGTNGDAEAPTFPPSPSPTALPPSPRTAATSSPPAPPGPSRFGTLTVHEAATLGARPGRGRRPSAGQRASTLASGADVFSIDVSRDGQLVATARFDGSVRGDAETGEGAFTVDAGPTVPGTTWIDAGRCGCRRPTAARPRRLDGSARVRSCRRSGPRRRGVQRRRRPADHTRAHRAVPGPDDGQWLDWSEAPSNDHRHRLVALPAPGHLVRPPIGWARRCQARPSTSGLQLGDARRLAGNTGVNALAFSADGAWRRATPTARSGSGIRSARTSRPARTTPWSPRSRSAPTVRGSPVGADGTCASGRWSWMSRRDRRGGGHPHAH